MVMRCPWAEINPLMISYHDTEWGIPQHNDKLLFEYLLLDNFQAGLSWAIVLQKREGFREAFDGFNVDKIACYTPEKIESLMKHPIIIKNRLKINAAVTNAQAFLRVQEDFGSFDRYLWQFVEGCSIQNSWHQLIEIPAKTLEAEAMSLSLKKRGFKFVGATICYAFMQSIGMVNDHLVDCFRYKALIG